MRAGLAFLAALLLVGAIQLTHSSAPEMRVVTAEVRLGSLAAGSTVGTNATNGSLSLAGCTILSCTDDLWYLNNTNDSSSYFVKLVATSTSGIGTITTLNVGIDNGTDTDQIQIASGSLTQSSGGYVQLSPTTTNRLYATSLVPLAFGTGSVIFDVYVSDDVDESAYYTMRATLTVT